MLCCVILCAPLSECEQDKLFFVFLTACQYDVVNSSSMYDVRIPGNATVRQGFGMFLADCVRNKCLMHRGQ